MSQETTNLFSFYQRSIFTLDHGSLDPLSGKIGDVAVTSNMNSPRWLSEILLFPGKVSSMASW